MPLASALPPPPRLPHPFLPHPLTPYMSLSLCALVILWHDLTISLKPAPPAVAPPPYIDPVLAKWQYNGPRYSGGGGLTSPPSPDPLHSWTRPYTDKSAYPPRSYSVAYLPAGRSPCVGNRPGSSQSEVTSPTTLHQKGVLLVPTYCKFSQKSGGLLPPALKFSTSSPTASKPSSNYPPLLSSCHTKLSAPSQGIWTLTPPPKISHRPEMPILWSSAPLPPAVAYASALSPVADGHVLMPVI